MKIHGPFPSLFLTAAAVVLFHGFGNTGDTKPGDPAKIWFKPAGLGIAKDGSLLIAGGVIWRVQHTGK